MNEKLFYILIYVGVSYLICLIAIIYMFKFERESLNIYGDFETDKGLIFMLTFFLAFSPVMLPMVIGIFIKDFVKEKIISRFKK